MVVVLKIAEKGGVHRVRFEAAPTYDSLNSFLLDLFPGCGGCRVARYTDEDGDSCLLTAATFPDFLHTARVNCGDVFSVLRLEVVLPSQGRHEAASEAADPPRAASRSSSPAASWLQLEHTDNGSSDGSWVCPGMEKQKDPGAEGRGRPDAVSSGAASRSRSIASNGERRSVSEASFEPLALRLADLRADDWGSSVCTSEAEVPAAAVPIYTPASGCSVQTLAEAHDTGSVVASAPEVKVYTWEEPASSEDAPHSSACQAPQEPAPFFDLDATPVVQTTAPPFIDLLTPAAPSSPTWAFAPPPTPMTRHTPAALAAAAETPVEDSRDVGLPPTPPSSPVDAGPPGPQGQWPDLEAGLGGKPERAVLEGDTPALDSEEPEMGSSDPRPSSPTAPRRRVIPPTAFQPPTRPVTRLQPPPLPCKLVRPVRVKEDFASRMVHMGHICDGCEACPLPGPRFTCKICPDFDLCWTCYMRRDQLPQPHDPTHRFQQVLWSEEVAPTCPGGCGFGITKRSGHKTHCCSQCAVCPGHHTDACHLANAHDDDLNP